MPNPEHLLNDLTWLRTLARQMARDDDLAEDLVQDTCNLALRQPEPPRQWRAWLTTVMSNLLHTHRARRVMIQRRLAAANFERTSEDAPTALQRAETQHRLVAAVLELDEPLRGTVLLRFFDGLPPRRIAAQQQVPIATVRSRLQRAMQRLRQRLDRDCGGRERWLAILAPVAWPRAAGTGSRWLAVVGLAATAAVVLSTVTERAPPAAPAAAVHSPTPTPDRSAPDPAPVVDPLRTAVAPAHLAANQPAAATDTVARFPLRGRVCDLRGRSVAGIAVTAIAGKGPTFASSTDVRPFARSGAGGEFAGELDCERAMLVAAQPGYTTLWVVAWSPQVIDPVLVVAPTARLAGRVSDPNGNPVPSGRLLLRLPRSAQAELPALVDQDLGTGWFVDIDRHGAFSWPTVPCVEGATLLLSAPAHEPCELPLPLHDDTAMQLVMTPLGMTPLGTGADTLRGTVLQPDGRPVEGALVALGLTSVHTDRDGRFALRLVRAGRAELLLAAKAGFAPARATPIGRDGLKASSWAADLVLQLGPPPGSVAGHVCDERGRPIAGAQVWIADPSPFGVFGQRVLQLEYLLGGAPLWSRGNQPMPLTAAWRDDPLTVRERRHLCQHEDEPTATWQFVTTGPDGAFTLPGMLDRDYLVRAFDPACGRFGECREVRAGGTLTITIAGGPVWPELRGRVETADGTPVAEVDVQQKIPVYSHFAEIPGGTDSWAVLRDGRTVRTAADGTFVLRDLSAVNSTLVCEGPAIMTVAIDLRTVSDPLAVRITAEARCVVEVELTDPGEADAVSPRGGDRRDPRVATEAIQPVPLRQGRSGRFVVGDGTRELLLWRDGKPGRRIAITPRPDALTRVQ